MAVRCLDANIILSDSKNVNEERPDARASIVASSEVANCGDTNSVRR